MLMDCAAIENAVDFAKFAQDTHNDLKSESTHGAVLFPQLFTKLYLIHLWTRDRSPTGQDLDRIWKLTDTLSVEASGMMLYSMVMEQAALEYQNNDTSKRPLSDITNAEKKDGVLSTENLLNLVLPRYSTLLSSDRILRLAGLGSTVEDGETVKNIRTIFMAGLHAAVKGHNKDLDQGLETETQRDLFLREINSSSPPFQVLEETFHDADVGSSDPKDSDSTFGTGFFYSLLNKATPKCYSEPAKLQVCDEYLGLMAVSVFAFAAALPAFCALGDDDYMKELVRNLDNDLDDEVSVYPFGTKSFLLGVKRAAEHLNTKGTAHIREDSHFQFIVKWLREKELVE